VTVTVAIPRPPASQRRLPAARGRAPAYVSAGTESFTISVNGALADEVDVDPSVSSCSAQAQSIACSARIDAPVGDDTFALTLYAGFHASGPVLSSGTAAQTVQLGAGNAVAIVLHGVVTSTVVALASPHPQMGAPSTTAMTVTAYDAAGAPITGTASYATPLTLVNSDASGATSLSATTLAGPNDPAPSLTYDGASFVNASITANAGPKTQTLAGVLQPVLRAAEFAVPSGNATNSRFGTGSLAVAGDGAIWFIDDTAIGRVTTGGSVTEHALGATPYGITLGPDGALWFTESGPAVARLTTGGTLSTYPSGTFGEAITAGPDGNVWYFASVTHEALVKVTPSGTQTTVPLQFPSSSSSSLFQALLVLGSDGNFWSADGQGDVARITPSGVVTLFPLPSSVNGTPIALATAADGALWLDTSLGSVARVTTAGTVTATYVTNVFQTATFQFAQGPDGAFWFPGGGGSDAARIGRIDAAGNAAIFLIPKSAPVPPSFFAPQPTGFVAGPDGNLWYTRGSSVGRVQLH